MPPFQHNPVRNHVDSADHLRRHPDEAATWNAPLPSTDDFGQAFSQLTPSNIPDKTAAAKTPGMMKKDFQKPSNFATGTILTDAALSSSRAGGVTGRRRKLSSQGATHSRNSAAPARWRAKETSATPPRRNATPLVHLYCQTIMCKPLALTPVSPGRSFAFPACAGCCSWSDAIWGRCCLSFGRSLTPPRMHPQAREETGCCREEYSHEDEEDRRTRGGGPSVSMLHASKSSR